MIPIETISGTGEGMYRRMMEGMNATTITCKNFGK
jgi:hypothetical protein